MTLTSDFQKLSVQGLITLYELDATALGAGVLRWHGHVGHEDWVKIYEYAGTENEFAGNGTDLVGHEYTASNKEYEIVPDIIWQGQVYTPIAIQSDGLEMRGDGKASTPNLSIANNVGGIQGAVSALCLQFEDFAGAKLTVTRTLAKYLDSANFSNGNPTESKDITNTSKKQIWYIEQKTSENHQVVSFELSNPVDLEGRKIPCREITNYCHWAVCGRYRDEECGYTGTARYTSDGKPTDNPELDRCGGSLSDCRLRFGENKELSFGGFPASSLTR